MKIRIKGKYGEASYESINEACASYRIKELCIAIKAIDKLHLEDEDKFSLVKTG